MNLNIKATHTTLTPAIEKYLEEKIKGLEKFFRPEDKIRIELEVNKKHQSGLVFRVEIQIHPHGLYAEARGNDFYEATDLALPKIKEQILKAKDKQITKIRSRARKVARSLKREQL